MPLWPPAEGDSLTASGLDSLAAVELSSSLSTTLGVPLPGTLVFDYPSVTAMAEYILSIMRPAKPEHIAQTNALPTDTLLAVPAGIPLQHGARLLVSLQMCTRLPVGYRGDTAGDITARASDSIRLVPFDRWDLEALRVRLAFATLRAVFVGVFLQPRFYTNHIASSQPSQTERQVSTACPSWRVFGWHRQVRCQRFWHLRSGGGADGSTTAFAARGGFSFKTRIVCTVPGSRNTVDAQSG